EFTETEARSALSLLAVEQFVAVDIETFEVSVCEFIRDSGSHRHANHFRGACRAAVAVKSVALRQRLAVELYRIGDPEAAETIEILSPAPDPGPEGVGSRSDLEAIDVMISREGGA
uniref:hypothetical protein n=1 Tax=Nocardia otitidiscaviarum TaxID=1823 RepID=UPI0005BAE025